ncbi:MAG: hypothetical protein IT287_08135, partial [Bdellovibrionaceae bacterium]|nr:hypothetical protein [Pseudobdellovibrionaceae bacterium]
MQIVKCLISLAVMLVFNFGHADVQVVSPYGLVLSQEEIKSLFAELQLKGNESYQLQDFVIETPFKTDLKGLTLSGSYEAQMAQGASALDFFLNANMSGLVLRIQKISTDTIIYKNIGGINVEVFLKGFCENIEIKSEDIATFSANVQLQVLSTGLAPHLDSVSVNKLPAWQVTMGQCQGPKGFDKALQAEIRNLLSNKLEIQKIMLNPITAKIKNVAKIINEKIFSIQDMPVSTFAQVQLKPEMLQVIGGNKGLFLLSGTAIANLTTKQEEVISVKDAAFETRIMGSQQTGVYFSQKWIQESILTAQTLNLLGYSFKS